MTYWLRGKKGGALAFAAIVLLVIGGLGWVTLAALRLEQEQAQTRAQAERTENLRLALWRMDSLVSPVLAQEDSRPANNYSAVFAPSLAINPSGAACSPGTVLEPSPLLDAELPVWILLHFQTSEDSGWESPQVLSSTLTQRLYRCPTLKLPPPDANQRRATLLADLGRQFPHQSLVAKLQPAAQPDSRTNTLVIPQSPWNYNPSLNQAQANNDLPPNQAPTQTASEFNKRVEAQKLIRTQSKA